MWCWREEMAPISAATSRKKVRRKAGKARPANVSSDEEPVASARRLSSGEEDNNDAEVNAGAGGSDAGEESDDGAIQMFAAVTKSHVRASSMAAASRRQVQGDAKHKSRDKCNKQDSGSASSANKSSRTAESGGEGLMGGVQEERTFDAIGLESWLVKACTGMGLTRPTDVQWHCVPEVLAGRDVMASAETGSGKTAAFALPILQMLASDPYGIFALVLTPTRELAFQIEEQFAALGSSISLRQSIVVGGLDMMKQATALCTRPHVVVATPGRLADHITSSHGVAAALKRTKFLVLDEADRLFEATFEKELAVILRALPQERRTLLFSATMTQSIQELQALGALKNCFQFEAHNPKTTVRTIQELYCHVPALVKDCYLTHIVRAHDEQSMIIFAGTKANCVYIALLLEELGHVVTALHSGLGFRV